MNRRAFSPAVRLALLISSLSFASASSAQDLEARSPDRAAPRERLFAPVQGGAARPGARLATHAPGRFLVKFRDAAIRGSQLDGLAPRGKTGPRLAAGPAIGVPSLDALNRAAGVSRIERAHIEVRDRSRAADLGVDRWFLLHVPSDADVLDLVGRYAADPNVEAATPDWRAFPAVVPNDPLHSMHWGHNNTGQMKNYCWNCGGHDSGTPVGTVGFDADAQPAWDRPQGYGSASVVIAILDSGVDIDHPDLRLVAGYDYGDNDTNPDDNSADPGHGTACAGVAAAMANNALGPAGAAGGCSIMPLKVADSGGNLYFSYIQNAIYHAADNGADVASMSFGAAISSDPATDNALVYAYNAGVTLVAATGNENASTVSYPAVHANVIGVGAASPCGERKRSSSNTSELNPGVSADPNGYTCDGERWWGSNYGSTTQDAAGAVDLLAPTILPTTDIGGAGGYASGDYSNWFNGTSSATPYAAGVCALIESANPTWTPAQVRSRLVSTATDVSSVESGAGWDRYAGYGMVNALAAVTGGPTQSYATLPYSTGFESGALDSYWKSVVPSPGRVRVLSTNTPHGGTYHLVMDSGTSGTYAQNEAWLHLNLSGQTNVDFVFWWKDFGDESHTQDGVYFSSNGGSSFVKVYSLNGPGYTDNTWRQFTLDLDQLAASNGLSLTSTFVVKLQQYDNYPITSDGMAFDDVSVAASTARSVTVTAPNGGETLTAGAVTGITWTSTGSIANVGLDYSTNAGSTWTQITASTPNDGAYDWTVPSSATTQGRVRVRDAADAAVYDTSNGSFTIQVPTPYATLPYSTGFEAGALDSYWATAVTANGRVRILSTNTPHGGTYHMVMDDATSGGYSQAEARLRLNLAGQTNVQLDFWWKEFGDETHTQDGVYFSSNGGSSFVKVQALNGGSYTNNTWTKFTLDLDQLAASNGLTLTSTFVVKFQQYDDYPITSDGMAFDDISVAAVGGGGITAETEPNNTSGTANGPVRSGTAVSGSLSSSTDDDWFYFDVATAGTVNISLAIGSSADLDWFLYNASLAEVARGYTTSNPETGSYTATAGRYYLFVDGYQGATSGYTLTVTGGLAKPGDTGVALPRQLALHQNVPNPFNPTTTIRFDLPAEGRVLLVVYDARGQLVRTLVDGVFRPGYHATKWDGRDRHGQRVASGMYLYRLEAAGRSQVRKMLVLK